MAAEARGLIVAETPTEGEARRAHPLYGEVVRAGIPTIRALRCACAWPPPSGARAAGARRGAAGGPLAAPGGGARPAAAGCSPRRAPQSRRRPGLSAQARGARGGGGRRLHATLLLARAHVVRKGFDRAEAVLAEAKDAIASRRGRRSRPTLERAIDYLEQRAEALFWGLNRPQDARDLLWGARPVVVERPGVGAMAAAAAARASPRRIAEKTPPERTGSPRCWRRRGSTLRPGARRSAGSPSRCSSRAARARPTRFAGRVQPSIPLRRYGDAMALGIRRLIGDGDRRGLARSSTPTWSGALRAIVHANHHEAAGHGALRPRLHLLPARPQPTTPCAGWPRRSCTSSARTRSAAALYVQALRVGPVQLAPAHEADAAVAAHERLLGTLAGREPALSQPGPLHRARRRVGAAGAGRRRCGARRSFLASAGQLDRMPGYASQLVYEALRAGAPARGGGGALSRRWGARCDARLVAAYAAHAAALAARDGAATLLEVSGEMAAIGADRYALEAAAHAAEAFLREGREDGAWCASARARELHAEGHGRAPAPSVDGLLCGAASRLTVARAPAGQSSPPRG